MPHLLAPEDVLTILMGLKAMLPVEQEVDARRAAPEGADPRGFPTRLKAPAARHPGMEPGQRDPSYRGARRGLAGGSRVTPQQVRQRRVP